MTNCSIECENHPHCECGWKYKEGIPHGYHTSDDLVHPQIMEHLEELEHQDKMRRKKSRSIAMYKFHQRRKSRPG